MTAAYKLILLAAAMFRFSLLSTPYFLLTKASAEHSALTLLLDKSLCIL